MWERGEIGDSRAVERVECRSSDKVVERLMQVVSLEGSMWRDDVEVYGRRRTWM